MPIKYILFFIKLLLLCGFTQAQSLPIKFGKVTEKDFAPAIPDSLQSAPAIVLCDYGETSVKLSPEFYMNHTRKTRILIKSKAGYDAANIEVPLYNRPNYALEHISSIDANTYNLENGKVVKSKLNASEVFNEVYSDYLTLKKFSLPNVKEGSIIEFSYTIASGVNIYLRPWEFQNAHFPTVWSEYRVSYPTILDYNTRILGFEPLSIDEKNTSTFENIETAHYRWVGKNMPPVKPENYMTTFHDYTTKAKFQLRRLFIPGHLNGGKTVVQDYFMDWNQVAKDYLKTYEANQSMGNARYFKNITSPLCSQDTTALAVLEKVFDHVKRTMIWDKRKGNYSRKNLKKAYEERIGNITDINMLLVQLLRSAGLQANPMFLSTRDNGKVFRAFTFEDQFNYLIAHVSLNGKDYLLDASDSLYTLETPSPEVINGDGLIISNVGVEWKPIMPLGKYATSTFAQISLNPNGQINGAVKQTSRGYAALEHRIFLRKNNREKFTGRYTYGGTAVKNLVFENETQSAKPFEFLYNIEASDYAQAANNIIYINPMLGHGIKEQPFKSATRIYPIDYNFNVDETFILLLQLPEGYEAEEIPANVHFTLPDNQAEYSYLLAKQGNSIQIKSRLKINKLMFMPDDYSNLKQFYEQIIAQQAQQIVLKKKN